MDSMKTHFLSADGYSEGYQLNTSLNSPKKDSLDKSFWRFPVRSPEVDMSNTAVSTDGGELRCDESCCLNIIQVPISYEKVFQCQRTYLY